MIVRGSEAMKEYPTAKACLLFTLHTDFTEGASSAVFSILRERPAMPIIRTRERLLPRHYYYTIIGTD